MEVKLCLDSNFKVNILEIFHVNSWFFGLAFITCQLHHGEYTMPHLLADLSFPSAILEGDVVFLHFWGICHIYYRRKTQENSTKYSFNIRGSKHPFTYPTFSLLNIPSILRPIALQVSNLLSKIDIVIEFFLFLKILLRVMMITAFSSKLQNKDFVNLSPSFYFILWGALNKFNLKEAILSNCKLFTLLNFENQLHFCLSWEHWWEKIAILFELDILILIESLMGKIWICL